MIKSPQEKSSKDSTALTNKYHDIIDKLMRVESIRKICEELFDDDATGDIQNESSNWHWLTDHVIYPDDTACGKDIDKENDSCIAEKTSASEFNSEQNNIKRTTISKNPKKQIEKTVPFHPVKKNLTQPVCMSNDENLVTLMNTMDNGNIFMPVESSINSEKTLPKIHFYGEKTRNNLLPANSQTEEQILLLKTATRESNISTLDSKKIPKKSKVTLKNEKSIAWSNSLDYDTVCFSTNAKISVEPVEKPKKMMKKSNKTIKRV